MLNALFAFESRSAGELAAVRLRETDLAGLRVEVHVHNTSPSEPVTSEVDELVTGGFVHSFLTLFEGVFDWGGSPHDAMGYARTVARGGAVLSVNCPTKEGRAVVERLMTEAGADERTDWRDAAAS